MSVDVEVCNGADCKSSPEGILGAPKGCLEFTVYGKAVPKERPRFGNGRAYTPEKTKNEEMRVGLVYKSVYRGFKYGKDVPLKMEIEIGVGIPKSASKKRKADMMSGAVEPTQKPDVENVAKLYMDALNGVAYHDDSQIVELDVIKRWVEEPFVKIRMEEVGGGAE